MTSSYRNDTAPPAQKRAQMPQPAHSSSFTVYPLAPGYGPPGLGTIAPRGQT